MRNLLTKKFMVVASLMMMMTLLASCGGETAKIPDTYKYDDLSQFVELGNYEGLKYKKPSTEVTEAEIQAKIDNALEAAATQEEVKDGVATDTSVLNVNYVGKVDGKEFEGGSAEGQSVDIANSSYIPGFAEGMVGHKVGETFDINVTFPEAYGNQELAGKDAVFTITINSMTEKSVPKFDDAFVKSNSDFKTTDEYKADVEKTLKESKEESAMNTVREDLFMKIVDDSNVKEYPETELAAAKEDMIQTYKDAATANGVSYEDYIKNQTGLGADDFEKQMVQVYAENMVKQELVLRALADKLELKFTDKDYEEFLMKLLDGVGMSKDQFKENYGSTIYEYAEKQNIYGSMIYEKVMDKVIEISTAK